MDTSIQTNLCNWVKELDPTAHTFLAGSGCLPYISNPRDLDMITIATTKEQFDTLMAYSRKYQLYWRSKGVHWIVRYTPDPNIWAIGHLSYIYHFCDDIEFKKYDIFNPEYTPRIIAACQRVIDRQRPHLKELYHVYATLCMLMRGDYELNEEEIERVNRFHDRQTVDSDYECVCKLLEEVKKKYEAVV